ncbi:MAG: WD40/YVTN/BNR-like repeat-containing protein [Candidatus Methanospirareceae archaeon]
MGRRVVQRPNFDFPRLSSDVMLKELFDAQSILAAILDNSPAALVIPEQRLVGRITGGNVAALTAAQVCTLLGIPEFPASDLDALMDFNSADFNVASKLLKLDANARVPVLQHSEHHAVDEICTPDYGLQWTDLGVIATDESAIVALGNGTAVLADLGGHVFRSTDYGATWTDLGAIGSAPASGCHAGNGIVLLGDETGHIYRSTDYGVSYMDLGDEGGAIYAIEYIGDGVVVAGAGTHILRSTDYGATWTDLGVITAGNVYSLAYLTNGIAICTGNTTHIHRSTDYGATWTDLGVVSSSSFVQASVYLGNGIALIGDGDGHVFRSTDYGATWTDIGATAGHIYALLYLGNGIVILGDNTKHVFRSTDYGLTWSDLGVVASHTIADASYLGCGIALISDLSGHVIRSTPAFAASQFNPYQFELLLQFGCLGAITVNGTSYLAPGNGSTQTNEISVRVPRAGILRNLHVQQRVASGAGGRTDIYTVRVNGADKAITCTLDNATSGEDTVHEVAVAQGDAVSIKLVSNDASDTSADVSASLVLV